MEEIIALVWPAAFIIYNIYIIIIMVLLLLDNREPASTVSWFFVLLVFPVIGLIIYLFFGRNWRTSPFRRKKIEKVFDRMKTLCLGDMVKKQEQEISRLLAGTADSNRKKILNLLRKSSRSLLASKNKVHIYHSGKAMFSDLTRDIEAAKKFIHLEYFIWKDDPLTRKIMYALCRKARQGVEVRILYDAFGSFFLPGSYKRELKRAGVMIYPYFNFLSPLKLHTLNYRNHRKIAVIDSRICYAGGMNMGMEYVTGGKRFDSWKDLHTRIEGDTAQVLSAIFATSWYNTTKESLFTEKYFSDGKSTSSAGPCQAGNNHAAASFPAFSPVSPPMSVPQSASVSSSASFPVSSPMSAPMSATMSAPVSSSASASSSESAPASASKVNSEVRDKQPYHPIQVTTSGPDSDWDSVKQLYFTLITSARHRVYVQSPYFVPDRSVFEALETAALAGLDVRIMMTGIPDKLLPYWSAHTYYKDLLRAGVRIYQYRKGFLHSKCVIVDSEISTIGTANMDMRSFQFNYELNLIFHDKAISKDLEDRFLRDIWYCKRFTMVDYRKLGLPVRLRNSFTRLFAPLF